MFICGTTRETTPNAASVMISAMSTGAPIMNAAAKMPENATCAPCDERADRRRVEQRHGLVGAREALDDPGVAADRDEDRDAEQRVELGDHRRLVARYRVDERAEREADQRVQQRARGLQARRTSRASA